MIKNTFLVEIGTEELPAQLLRTLINTLYKNFIDELNKHNIKYKKINYFATPRRLALQVIEIHNLPKIEQKIKKGPSIKNAFDENGNFTPTVHYWAKQYNIDLNKIKKLTTSKGEWLTYSTQTKQIHIQSIIPQIIEKSLKNIHTNYLMKWDKDKDKFFRPIRNIVIMLNKDIIKEKIFNIQSNNILYNHISDKEKTLHIYHAKDYPDILFRSNKIIANYDMRKKSIIIEIHKIEETIQGKIHENNALLEEVTALVESPKVLLGSFNKNYINSIPKEILAYTIEKQQKCFSVYDLKGSILPYFIFVTNINPPKPKKIILGNEKVIHARLSDTMFFLKKDKKIKLENYLNLLKKVLFHENLGTLYQKTLRLKSLIKWISNYTININKKNLIRAALLSKCDLVTNMVSEFPELQGTIGMQYALQDHENKEICIAIQEQYLPSFSGDKLPSTLIGSILSITDKIDTLSGLFCVNQIPSSDQDPFKLRRIALGIMRIIIHCEIPLNMTETILKSFDIHNLKIDYSKKFDQIKKFFISRLLSFYVKKGYHVKVIKSVLSNTVLDFVDIDKKIQAISQFTKISNFQSIMLIIKRISNILKYHDKKYENNVIKINLIKQKEEKELFQLINNFKIQTKELFIKKEYTQILSKIKILEKPINTFFKTVQINHINPEVRKNRLILLTQLKKIFFKITNFSILY